jgi:1,4-alpha-glucan branching enzyme
MGMAAGMLKAGDFFLRGVTKMKKEPVRNSSKVSVTFEMPAEVEAQTLTVVGDFNAWDEKAAPMQRRKDGTWARTIRLEPGAYAYRYLADGVRWLNDWSADRYEPSGLGDDNSVVVIEAL